jgi:hypothetical protein
MRLAAALAFVAGLASAPGAVAVDPTVPNQQQGTEIQAFLSTAWTVVQDPADVLPRVMRALTAKFGDDQRLAGPGAPFEGSDLVSGKPTRRFLLAGKAEALWFIAYEHGGIAHHIVVAVFDASHDPPTPGMLAVGTAGVHNDIRGWRVSLDDLKKGLTKGTLTAADSHGYY